MTHPGGGTERPAGSVRGRWRRGLRRVLLGVVLLLVVVIVGVGWVGVDALRARGELKAAAGQVHVLEGQVEKGDRRAAALTLKSLQVHSAAALAGTHGPQWSAVRVPPWLGANVGAVQTVSEVIEAWPPGRCPR